MANEEVPLDGVFLDAIERLPETEALGLMSSGLCACVMSQTVG
jgi:hypothetical protein